MTSVVCCGELDVKILVVNLDCSYTSCSFSMLQVCTSKKLYIIGNNATPLLIASGSGHLDVVKLLVEAGAEVDAMTDAGWTPLRAACAAGHAAVVKYLVERGAELGARGTERNCLIAASTHPFVSDYDVTKEQRENLEQIFCYLLENGADPNEKTCEG